MTTSNVQLAISGHGEVTVTVDDQGDGKPYLLLHGGAGPQSVIGFGELLRADSAARVITPVHPGFGGTPRPDWLTSVPGLASVYSALLDQLDLHEVTVIGNSIGGWIAAELAVASAGRIGSLVIVDGVGIDVAGHPVADAMALNLDQLADLSFHDPAKFRIDLDSLPPEQRAGYAANRAALAVYAGSMMDPTLLPRLAGITAQALVIWGDADRIADAEYGKAFAAGIPGARFVLLPTTGHMPQLESPQLLLRAVTEPGFTPAG
jgi:pimeloyl-ACP methyl ester carboxylesterase